MTGAGRPGGTEDRRRRIAIAARFAAADGYDANSPIQREAAARLVEQIASLPIAAASSPTMRPRVLEIGCGTGHLSELLVRARPEARFLFTDVAAPMVARCRERLALSQPGRSAADFAAMDGEHPALGTARFDLIASSMTFQWFDQLGPALARLVDQHLAPGGWLAFVTPGAATFREWQRAHDALGLPCGALPYPSADEIRALCVDALRGGAVRVSTAECVSRHPDAQSFLHGLKAIGATVPRAGHRPLPYSALRAVMRQLESQSGSGGEVRVTYQLVFATLQQKESLP